VPQLHVRAESGDVAPIVLLPGDPDRAARIADRFDGGLAATKQFNVYRRMYGYTGTYHGTPVSVQTTGMGTPSLSIVVEELLRLGARRFVRVGTCGGIGRGVKTGDLVIAQSATPLDGSTATYLHGEPYAPTADFGLVRALDAIATARGAAHHVGQVCTVDVFYNPDSDYTTKWRERGILAFEMETSALYYLAARAYAAGADVRAATILTVSDVLSEELKSEDTYLSPADLERSVYTMIEVALEAAIATL